VGGTVYTATSLLFPAKETMLAHAILDRDDRPTHADHDSRSSESEKEKNVADIRVGGVV
jgi:hypothetical protein